MFRRHDFVIVLALAACTACSATRAQSSLPAAAGERRTLSVAATATIHIPPDCASVQLTFQSENQSLSEAHRRVSAARSSFLRSVRGFDARIETGRVDYRPMRQDHARGRTFIASQSVVVTTERFGDIPAIVGGAGPGLAAVSVDYFVSDLSQHRSRLRTLAITAGRRKAAELAEGFDTELGAVVSLAEGNASNHSFAVGNEYVAAVHAPDPSGEHPPPGAIPLTVTLRISYELRG